MVLSLLPSWQATPCCSVSIWMCYCSYFIPVMRLHFHLLQCVRACVCVCRRVPVRVDEGLSIQCIYLVPWCIYILRSQRVLRCGNLPVSVVLAWIQCISECAVNGLSSSSSLFFSLWLRFQRRSYVSVVYVYLVSYSRPVISENNLTSHECLLRRLYELGYFVST